MYLYLKSLLRLSLPPCEHLESLSLNSRFTCKCQSREELLLIRVFCFICHVLELIEDFSQNQSSTDFEPFMDCTIRDRICLFIEFILSGNDLCSKSVLL